MNRRLYPLFIGNQILGMLYIALSVYRFPELVRLEATGEIGIGVTLGVLAVYALFVFNHVILERKTFKELS